MEINTLIAFFGWCSVINIAILLLSMLLLTRFRKTVSVIHGKLFGLNPEELPSLYMHYIGSYKLLILVFNLVPYIALKLLNPEAG